METKYDEVVLDHHLYVLSMNPTFRKQPFISSDDGDRNSLRNICFLFRTDANNRWSGPNGTDVLYYCIVLY